MDWSLEVSDARVEMFRLPSGKSEYAPKRGLLLSELEAEFRANR